MTTHVTLTIARVVKFWTMTPMTLLRRTIPP
jgi:hypothetical protein